MGEWYTCRLHADYSEQLIIVITKQTVKSLLTEEFTASCPNPTLIARGNDFADYLTVRVAFEDLNNNRRRHRIYDMPLINPIHIIPMELYHRRTFISRHFQADCDLFLQPVQQRNDATLLYSNHPERNLWSGPDKKCSAAVILRRTRKAIPAARLPITARNSDSI